MAPIGILFVLLCGYLGFVHSQSCYIDVNCPLFNGEIPLMGVTVSDCCFDPQRLAVQTDEGCLACLIYGFTQTTLIARERSEDYQVFIDFYKGFVARRFPIRSLLYSVQVLPGSTTAVSGEDYVFQERRILLNTPGPFPINITILEDDLALEPNRTLTLQIVYVSGIRPVGEAIFFMNQIDIVIEDADVPRVNLTFEESSVTYSEDSGGGMVCIEATGPSFIRSIPVLITFENGTAYGNDDFEYPSGGSSPSVQLDVSEATRKVCVAVVILQDGAYEGDETFVLRMSTSDEETEILQSTVNVTIVNSDNVTMGFTSSNYTAEEGDSSVEICVAVFSGILETEVTVVVLPMRDTAVGLSDFSPLPVFLTFSSSSTEQCGRITLLDDNEFEALSPERFLVQLTSIGFDGVILDPSRAEVFIEDNDVVTVQFVSGANVTEGSNFTICLEKSVTTAVEFQVFISSRDGTARNGRDYTSSLIPSVVNFPPSVTITCFTSSVLDDPVALEPDQQFALVIDSITPSSSRVRVLVDEVQVTIQDNDVVTVQYVSGANVTEGSNFTICLEKSVTTAVELQVLISSRDGTAQNGRDYTSSLFPSVVNFPPSVTITCFTSSVLDDPVALEPDQQFALVIDSITPSSSSIRILVDEVQVTIQDNDVVTVQFVSGANVTEGSNFTICLEKSVTTAVELQVLISSRDGTATNGRDYTSSLIPSVVNFPPSATITCFTSSVLDDPVALEPDQQFALVIDSITPSSSRVRVLVDEVQVTIQDNDVVTVQFVSGANVTEGSNFTICLEKSVTTAVELQVLISSRDATAQNGRDYTSSLIPSVVNFPPSVTITCFTSSVLDDPVALEPDQQFALVIDSITPSSSSIRILVDEVQVTIQDNDVVTVQFVSGANVTEGSNFTICLEKNVTTAVEFQVLISSRDGTATNGRDYTSSLIPSMVNFPPSVTITCFTSSVLDDPVALEPDQQFALVIDSITPSSSSIRILVDDVQVTIQDNDVVTVQFVSGANVTEGSNFTICLEKSVTTAVELQVLISSRDGTAQNGRDYTSSLIPSVANFPPSVTISCFTSSVLDDQVALEPDQQFALVIDSITPSSSRVRVLVDEVQVTIQDNDDLTISSNMRRFVVQEDAGVVGICLEALPVDYFGTVQVQITYQDGSATEGLDYDSGPPSVVFDGTDNMECFNTSITDDGFLEQDTQNFSILLSSLDPRVSVAPATIEVVIIDTDEVFISWINGSSRVNEDVGEVTLCASLTGSTAVPVSVDVEIAFGRGMAKVNEDFLPDTTPKTLVFQPGGDSVQCTILDIIDDSDIESLTTDENLYLQLMKTVQSDRIVLPLPETRILIVDNEEVVAGFGSGSVQVMESDKDFTYCLNKTTLENMTFYFSVQPASALEGQDYLLSGLPVEATLTQVMTLCQLTGEAIVDNNVGLQPIRFFSMTINRTSPESDRIRIFYAQFQIAILDDDVVVVEFTSKNFTVLETAGVATVCVNKNIEIATPFTADLRTVDLTAIAGTDYIGGSFSVTFSPLGGNTACVNMTILPDNAVESGKRFALLLDLAGSSQFLRLGSQANTTVIIVDPVPQISVNDTVTGDPVMTVPILVTADQLSQIGDGNAQSLSLCYEVHGTEDTWFNMVTDECTSVNAHYASASTDLNVIDEIGIQAVNDNSECVNIEVKVQDCSASVDGRNLGVMGRYSVAGISVRRYSNRVRVSVPNCADLTLVMWMICEETLFPHDLVTAKLIEFVVMRGLNRGHRQAHGILGQFWNNPVSVAPYSAMAGSGSGFAATNLYTVNVTTSGLSRSYVGEYRKVTWEHKEEPCLYVGDSQASPLGGNLKPNDGVLEGDYTDYIVAGAFTEAGNFKFGLFDARRCIF